MHSITALRNIRILRNSLFYKCRIFFFNILIYNEVMSCGCINDDLQLNLFYNKNFLVRSELETGKTSHLFYLIKTFEELNFILKRVE